MPKLSEEMRAYFRALGTRGGQRAAAAMTPAQRKARATKASKAAKRARDAKKKSHV